jgi:hypothetical protein
MHHCCVGHVRGCGVIRTFLRRLRRDFYEQQSQVCARCAAIVQGRSAVLSHSSRGQKREGGVSLAGKALGSLGHKFRELPPQPPTISTKLDASSITNGTQAHNEPKATKLHNCIRGGEDDDKELLHDQPDQVKTSISYLMFEFRCPSIVPLNNTRIMHEGSQNLPHLPRTSARVAPHACACGTWSPFPLAPS